MYNPDEKYNKKTSRKPSQTKELNQQMPIIVHSIPNLLLSTFILTAVLDYLQDILPSVLQVTPTPALILPIICLFHLYTRNMEYHNYLNVEEQHDCSNDEYYSRW